MTNKALKGNLSKLSHLFQDARCSAAPDDSELEIPENPG